MWFFLWGYIKSIVYRTQPANLDKLQQRIERAFANLSQEVIDRAVDAHVHRLEKILDVDGASVEL